MHFLYYFMGKKSCLNMITVSIDQILSSSLAIQRSDLNKETRTYIELILQELFWNLKMDVIVLCPFSIIIFSTVSLDHTGPCGPGEEQYFTGNYPAAGRCRPSSGSSSSGSSSCYCSCRGNNNGALSFLFYWSL